MMGFKTFGLEPPTQVFTMFIMLPPQSGGFTQWLSLIN